MMTATAEILLVDDNPADLDLTIDALAQSPRRTHVSTVCDGAEAMAYLLREGKYAEAIRPHLVLLDLNLPRKDGRSVLLDMKSKPALRRIPVVIFSSSRAQRTSSAAMNWGPTATSANLHLGRWVSREA